MVDKVRTGATWKGMGSGEMYVGATYVSSKDTLYRRQHTGV